MLTTTRHQPQPQMWSSSEPGSEPGDNGSLISRENAPRLWTLRTWAEKYFSAAKEVKQTKDFEWIVRLTKGLQRKAENPHRSLFQSFLFEVQQKAPKSIKINLYIYINTIMTFSNVGVCFTSRKQKITQLLTVTETLRKGKRSGVGDSHYGKSVI